MRAFTGLLLAVFALEVSSFTKLATGGKLKRKFNLYMSAEHHDTILYAANLMDSADALREHLHHGTQQLWDQSLVLADGIFAKPADSGEAASNIAASSPYTKVDKTGFIGGIADVIEKALVLGHTTLQSTGLQYTYGLTIILFTVLVKAATLPLLSVQLESTSKLQAIAPMQKEITEKYADNDQAKNILLAQLYQSANVNPLAGCIPALVQLPVFLSLYRALTNLIAENRLSEPFLFIPNLQGPVYASGLPDDPANTGAGWLLSIITGGGEPLLGWTDTLAFLTLPVILYVSQTISQKALQPPRDPSKPMTEQEEISQGILNNLPFIVAFFSINVPAGLGIYWIFNNIITTALNLGLKQKFAETPLSPAVEALMQQIKNDEVDIDAMLAANPMGGPASTNPGLVDTSNGINASGGGGGAGLGGNTAPDFGAMLKDQQEASAKASESAQEKAEAMMREAVEKANREKSGAGIVDVEATPSEPEEAAEENSNEDDSKD